MDIEVNHGYKGEPRIQRGTMDTEGNHGYRGEPWLQREPWIQRGTMDTGGTMDKGGTLDTEGKTRYMTRLISTTEKFSFQLTF